LFDGPGLMGDQETVGKKADSDMIKLTRFDGSEVAVNAEMIKFVEAAPDTIITLTTDQKLLVLETVDEVIEGVIEYKKLIYGSWPEIRERAEERGEEQQ
jgi:flagellar protein FlbD